MDFYLNNEHRKYMGLKPIKESYEKLNFDSKFGKFTLFIEDNTIKKVIEYNRGSSSYSLHEIDVNYKISADRSLVLPKTDRGKPRKLNYTTISSLNGEGTYVYIYFEFDRKYAWVLIGNYTTQRSFLDIKIENIASVEDIKKWCDNFVLESTKEDLEEVWEFSSNKRVHVKYQEGDYFRVKLNRHLYTYGRLVMDIPKRKKVGLKYWDIFMGKPLIVETFYILTDRKDLKAEDLENIPTFPAEHIFGNNLYYGDYEIVDHGEVPKNVRYPIMYGKSISGIDPNKIMFQCGEIYREMEYMPGLLILQSKPNYYGSIEDFKNHGIGYRIHKNEKIIRKCIEEKSELPFWNAFYTSGDLRSPENREKLMEVLKQFHLEELEEIYVRGSVSL